MDIIEGEVLPSTKGKQKRPISERKAKAMEVRASQLRNTGRMLASCPMIADELATQWGIGTDDVETVTVKILRQILGTREQEFMGELPLVDYRGAEVAGRFGPGTYYLRPASGPYERHSTKLPISDKFARDSGWGRVPRASIAETAAAQTIMSASEGATDPKALLLAMSQMMDSKLEDFRRTAPMGPIAAPANSFEGAEQEMARVERMMGFMERLEARAVETVQRRMGVVNEDKAPESNTNILLSLLPKALEIVGSLMAPQRPLNPAPQSQQASPALAESPAPPPPQPAPPQPAPPPEAIPMLTKSETKSIQGAVAMLRPFAANLMSMVRTQATNEQIIGELAGYIPPSLYESLSALGLIVEAKGAAVLAHIHPELATDRWKEILRGLNAELAREE